tara:strand:- start:596 stop:862 length:267 start_codon:yes stop_codon:yes gene_type:complete
MFGVSPALVALLKKMGDYLQSAIKRAMLDAAQGVKTDPDDLSDWLETQMSDWQPTLKGRRLSDPKTQKAAARFLAGVACNFAFPQKES